MHLAKPCVGAGALEIWLPLLKLKLNRAVLLCILLPNPLLRLHWSFLPHWKHMKKKKRSSKLKQKKGWSQISWGKASSASECHLPVRGTQRCLGNVASSSHAVCASGDTIFMVIKFKCLSLSRDERRESALRKSSLQILKQLCCVQFA